jgi:prepilin-type N-terminal cleavage/methylation domain-containing protein
MRRQRGFTLVELAVSLTIAAILAAVAMPSVATMLAGNRIRTGGTDLMSHHAVKLSNGNFIVMRDAQVSGRTSKVFEEFDPANQLVHTIGVEDAVTPCSGASGDWAHGNSITVDLEDDAAYMSFRWLGVIKMQYSTKTMLWHLPASYGAQGMGDMSFVPADSQFSDIHDPEIHDDGTILFFDNGGFTGVIEDGNPSNLHTRAVEYKIDEQATTATLEWEWPGDFETDP